VDHTLYRKGEREREREREREGGGGRKEGRERITAREEVKKSN